MVKRLIMCLIAISLLAMLWPAAASAACQWIYGKDPANPSKWCCWESTGYKNVNGTWVECGYCTAYFGGSNYVGLEFKRTEGNKCIEDDANGDRDCPYFLGVMFGRAQLSSTTCTDPDQLDPSCGIYGYLSCCPQGNWDPIEEKCDWPGQGGGEGVPIAKEGIGVGGESIGDYDKKNVKAVIPINFESADICPSANMVGEFIALEFNGLACMFPNGWDEKGGELVACAQWNEDRTSCEEFNEYKIPEKKVSEDEWERKALPSATVLECDKPESFVWEAGVTVTWVPDFENADLNQGKCRPLNLPDGVGAQLCLDLLELYLNE